MQSIDPGFCAQCFEYLPDKIAKGRTACYKCTNGNRKAKPPPVLLMLLMTICKQQTLIGDLESKMEWNERGIK